MIYPGPGLDDGQVSLGPATIDDVRAAMPGEDVVAGIPELTRAVIITSVDNVASQRLAQRCGFTYVGPAREGPDGMVFEWRIRRGSVNAVVRATCVSGPMPCPRLGCCNRVNAGR